MITLKSYVKNFQYKVLNSILFTDNKLYKVGFRTNDLGTFCEAQPKSLNNQFAQLPLPFSSKQLWNDFEIYWCIFSNKIIRIFLQNVLAGIITGTTQSLHILLNYFIIIGKLFKIVELQTEITKFFPTFMNFEQQLLLYMKLKTQSVRKKKLFGGAFKYYGYCLLIAFANTSGFSIQ